MEELRMVRKIYTDKSTSGELYLPDGSFAGFTLEDKVRDHKVPGQTAIPSGRYQVVVTFSNRFQRPMPLLVNVPFYRGIRIHPGNTPDNTEGCILVGRRVGDDAVWESRAAFDELFPKIRKLCEVGKLYINIEGGIAADRWVKV